MAKLTKEAVFRVFGPELQVAKGIIDGDVKVWSTSTGYQGSPSTTNTRFFLKRDNGKLVEVYAPASLSVETGHAVSSVHLGSELVCVYNDQTEVSHWYPMPLRRAVEAGNEGKRLVRIMHPAVFWPIFLVSLIVVSPIGLICAGIIFFLRLRNIEKVTNLLGEISVDLAKQQFSSVKTQ